MTDFDAEPGVADLPVPEPGPGEVLVRLAAAGVNPFDFKVIEGAMRGSVEHAFPLVLGSDGAGTVERVGEGADFEPGERVFGQFMDVQHGRGSYAEYAVAKAAKLARMPAGLSFATAAALPTAGAAAHDFVEGTGIGPGCTLLVNGASGGVGQAAVQLAAAQGVRVIGTTDPDTAVYLRELGAAETVDFTQGPTTDQVRLAHPDGIDAIVDLISGPGEIEPIAALLKPNGVIVSSNGAVDDEVLATRGLRGANLYANARPATLKSLAEAVEHGQLRLRIDYEVPLEGAAEALARLKAGKSRGKTVLLIE
ncbi:NADP-dependent oxidoreductase [Glycomyces algeriensis]|uniref:NADP-dependent oxidoreductase n=1 Tax=Glycomyces algeriensis TaxID=256037 RepID=UPI0022D1EB4D|nr:NADP-dependent oxidoreductase [Glycomyces algeriensis]MDA1368248.1 NADP-dependent oxidoreductase [Glycomyces algeriensis]MDR7351888.1 NADPH:quinone reductase-like Zn-dependent oxidoreductase [Glycomyces algeriensis]